MKKNEKREKKREQKNIHCLTYWAIKESPFGQEKSTMHKRGKEESLCS